MACFESFLAAYKKMSSSVKLDGCGRKENELIRKRKSGRSEKLTSQKAINVVAAGGYLAIRKSNRVSICNGCKVPFSADTKYVIQHKCKLPYPAKSVDGKVVMVSPP